MNVRSRNEVLIPQRKRREPYSQLEERKMWKFFARELRVGNDDALKRRPQLWRLYEQEENTTKTWKGLESHFRKYMRKQILNASMDREDMFLCLRFFDVRLTRQQQIFLEQRFGCDVECLLNGSFRKARFTIGRQIFTLPTEEEEATILEDSISSDQEDDAVDEADHQPDDHLADQQPLNTNNAEQQEQANAEAQAEVVQVKKPEPKDISNFQVKIEPIDDDDEVPSEHQVQPVQAKSPQKKRARLEETPPPPVLPGGFEQEAPEEMELDHAEANNNNEANNSAVEQQEEPAEEQVADGQPNNNSLELALPNNSTTAEKEAPKEQELSMDGQPNNSAVADGQPNNNSLDLVLPNNSATGDDTCITTENNNSPGTTSTTPPAAAAVEQEEDEDEDEREFVAKAKQQFIEGALEVIRKGSKANLQRFVDPFLFIEGGKYAEGARGIAWLARDDNDNELAYE